MVKKAKRETRHCGSDSVTSNNREAELQNRSYSQNQYDMF